MSENIFQGIIRGFEDLVAKFSKGGAKAVDADTLHGLKV